MNTRYLQIFAAALALSTFGLAFAAGSTDSTLKDVAGYRDWTRLGEKPIAVVDTSFAG